MKIDIVPIESVHEYPQNPRSNDSAVQAVAASIKEFGFRVPVIVDANRTIVAGHTRVKAARSLGLTTIPIHVAEGLTETQIRALRIADNKVHELSSWNFDLLPIELNELKALDYDLSVLGFDDPELQRLLNATTNTGLVDPDDIPAPPDTPVTRRGDQWRLGRHSLLCGDSGNAADVDRLLGGAPIHLVNTDPPYNVKVEPRSNNAIRAGLSSFEATHHQKFDAERRDGEVKATHKQLRARDRPLMNDFVSDEAFDAMVDAWFANIARVLLPGRCFYIWAGYSNMRSFPLMLERHGLYFSQAIIWHKQWPVLTRKNYLGDHEWAYFGWREGAAHQFFGPSNATDVWSIRKVAPQNMVHITEKVVELAARAIEHGSQPGENVLDLFGGSGSTLIACEQLGRVNFSMELDPLYVDVIVRRWENFTSKKAELIRGDGTESPEKAPAAVAGAAVEAGG